MNKYFLFIPIAMIVIAVPATLLLSNRNKVISPEVDTDESIVDGTTKDNSDDRVEETRTEADGSIIVEAGSGTLLNSGYMSYIQESARGLEAYLAEKGATAAYEVEVPELGDYLLSVALSDDGEHEHGTRDVTIVVNNLKTLGYNHTSQDTKGWKWFEIGTAPLKRGKNTILFTKNETTSAAYVMDEFKLTIVK